MSDVRVQKVIVAAGKRYSTVNNAVDAIAEYMTCRVIRVHDQRALAAWEKDSSLDRYGGYSEYDRIMATAKRRITPIIKKALK